MIADSVIADHFRGFGTYKNATCGFGYGVIREMIDEMLLKPEFKARIERKAEAIFEEYFEKALHEAAERAAYMTMKDGILRGYSFEKEISRDYESIYGNKTKSEE